MRRAFGAFLWGLVLWLSSSAGLAAQEIWVHVDGQGVNIRDCSDREWSKGVIRLAFPRPSVTGRGGTIGLAVQVGALRTQAMPDLADEAKKGKGLPVPVDKLEPIESGPFRLSFDSDGRFSLVVSGLTFLRGFRPEYVVVDKEGTPHYKRESRRKCEVIGANGSRIVHLSGGSDEGFVFDEFISVSSDGFAHVLSFRMGGRTEVSRLNFFYDISADVLQCQTLELVNAEGEVSQKYLYPQDYMGDVHCFGLKYDPNAKKEYAAILQQERKQKEEAYDPDSANSWRQSTATRERICLSGVWKAVLFEERPASKPSAGAAWSYIQVPGKWYRSLDPFLDDVLPRVNPSTWRGKALSDMNFCWYRREFRVPESWRGRKTLLEFDRVSSFAEVYLNGDLLAKMEEGDEPPLDVTERVKITEGNLLEVLVQSAAAHERKVWAGPGQTWVQKSAATSRGIVGDVWLRSVPARAYIDDLFVTTSVRRKKVALRACVINPSGERTRVRLLGEVTDGGEVVKTFESDDFTLSGAEEEILDASFSWRDAIPWDTDNPHLYTLKARLVEKAGGVIDEIYPIRFGFRELRISGRDFYLNGKRIHFRIRHHSRCGSLRLAARPNVERDIQFLLDANYSAIETAGERASERGQHDYYFKDILDVADEKGMLVFFSLPKINDFVRTYFKDETKRLKWQRAVRKLVKMYRNHPSVVMWSMNFNLLGYQGDMHPLSMASRFAPSGDKWLDTRKTAAADSEAFVHSLDPSRVIYHHQCGNFGQVNNVNHYLCFPPQQEKEEMPSLWSRRGRKPYVAIELGMPLFFSYLCGRMSYRVAVKTEPMFAEYAAMQIGERSYRSEPEQLIPVLDAGASETQFTGQHKLLYDSYETVSGQTLSILRSPWRENYLDSQCILTKGLLRAWRTWGISGMCPWTTYWGQRVRFDPRSFAGSEIRYPTLLAPGPKPATLAYTDDFERYKIDAVYQENMRPLLCYIGGRRDYWLGKDHAYFSGERVHKQLIMVNDLRGDARVRASWKVEDGSGAIVATGEEKLAARPGEVGMEGFNFKTPEVGEKTTLFIKARFEGAGQVAEDRFELQVWPGPEPIRSPLKFALYDPERESRGMFRRADIDFRRIGSPSDVEEGEVLVLGTGALEEIVEDGPLNLHEFVDVKGGTVLVLEQRADELERLFGLRAHDRSTRYFFIPRTAEHHPLNAGLNWKDLWNWRGESTILEPYPEPRDLGKEKPMEVWKWGNANIVASTVIQKPTVLNFRPLVDGEHDLEWTPLMEVFSGRGVMLFCQFDLADHHEDDPAAQQVFRNIVRYLEKPTRLERKELIYLAKKESALLKKLNFQSYWLGDLPVGKEAIVFADNGCGQILSARRAEVLRFVERGGILFCCGLTAEDFEGDWLPKGVKIAERTFFRAEVPATDHRMFSGLSTSDLYLKSMVTAAIPVELPEGSIASNPASDAWVPHGKGAYILMQPDPLVFCDRKKGKQRYDRAYYKCMRTLSILMTNAGARLDETLANAADERWRREFIRQACPPISLEGRWDFRTDPENVGLREGWQAADFKGWKWDSIVVPGFWEEQGVTDANPNVSLTDGAYNGIAWYRRRVEIPRRYLAQGYRIVLTIGAIDDLDEVFFNGVKIGATTEETENYWAVSRTYAIPPRLIEADERNSIAIRVTDLRKDGGIYKSPVCIQLDLPEPDIFPYLEPSPPYNPFVFHRW